MLQHILKPGNRRFHRFRCDLQLSVILTIAIPVELPHRIGDRRIAIALFQRLQLQSDLLFPETFFLLIKTAIFRKRLQQTQIGVLRLRTDLDRLHAERPTRFSSLLSGCSQQLRIPQTFFISHAQHPQREDHTAKQDSSTQKEGCAPIFHTSRLHQRLLHLRTVRITIGWPIARRMTQHPGECGMWPCPIPELIEHRSQ